jgi:ABC-type glycerol-3-phosphate transport system permease component
MTATLDRRSFLRRMGAGQFNDQWNLVLPATVMAGLPVLAFFWILSRYLVRGLTAGGVKG